jgi:hypothetical protein
MIALPASFHIMFLSDGIAASISKQVQSVLLILVSGLFARICLSVPLGSIVLLRLPVLTLTYVCVSISFLLFQWLISCTE